MKVPNVDDFDVVGNQSKATGCWTLGFCLQQPEPLGLCALLEMHPDEAGHPAASLVSVLSAGVIRPSPLPPPKPTPLAHDHSAQFQHRQFRLDHSRVHAGGFDELVEGQRAVEGGEEDLLAVGQG